MNGERPRARRQFSEEFKAEVVELCRQGDRSIGKLAEDLDLTETAVRRWLAQADSREGRTAPLGQRSEAEELAQLRKENRLLREERDVLKRAVSFFAREIR